MATAKSTTKAASTEAAKVTLSASAIAAINSAVSASANADGAKEKAFATSEQNLIKLAFALRDAKFPSRDDARDYVKPLLLSAYTKAKLRDPKMSADSQTSRALSIAFPKDDIAKTNVTRAIDEELSVNQVIGMSTGRYGFDKKGEITERKPSTRGGANRKNPFETYKKAIEDAVTAFAKAKGKPAQFLNPVIDAMVACEVVEDSDEAIASLD